MYSEAVIVVEDLGKAYRQYASPWHQLLEWLRPSVSRHDLIWAFRHLNFQVHAGESLAIIGRNGAGKSTLLKVLCGVTEATEGRYEMRGHTAALLELGMAFEDAFTGRQNVYLSASLMGYDSRQVDAVIEQIEAFAEIGDFFDRPLRTYSSGMRVRLAFSVATAFRPDVLIVDEALSVGDAYFQSKCFRRIREFREAGTTLLFVSHDAGAIRALCDRALLLDDGRILHQGPPTEVLDYYNALIAIEKNEDIRTTEQGAIRSGDGRAVIHQASWLSRGRPVQAVQVGEPLTLRVDFEVREPLGHVTLGFMLKDRLGNPIYGTNTWHLGMHGFSCDPGHYRVDMEIEQCLLGPGQYTTTIALHDFYDHVAGNYDWWEQALKLEVVPDADRPQFEGVCALDVHARVSRP